MAGLFSIPADRAFAPALARHLLAEFGQEPAGLSRVTVLLPTRRAILALRQAFLDAARPKALLLPAMAALGDAGEDEADAFEAIPMAAAALSDEPPAVGELERHTLLTRLVYEWLSQEAPLAAPPPLEQAALLAGALARLIDRVETAGLDFAALEALTPEDRNLARHWEDSLAFLKIVTEAWPAVLEERGLQGAANRRRRLMLGLAERWGASPPSRPVIAAGSTGSIPATRSLLGVIAGLPEGRVILPGLDLSAGEEEWEAVASDPTHPQFGMAELLEAMKAGRDQVREIEGDAGPPPRQRLISLAMRPPQVSEAWAEQAEPMGPRATDGIVRIDCEHPGEEATVIALILRETLEHEARTAALVTPDRALARRVVSLLGRWGIEIDDSAGASLSATPVGAYLRLVAAAALQPDDPVALLSLLKHPLTRAGMGAAAFGEGVRALDLCLRKDVAGRSWRILQRLESPWARAVIERLGPLIALAGDKGGPVDALLQAHMEAAEALAEADDEPGSQRLWRGEDGEAAAAFVDELRLALSPLPDADMANYAGLFEALIGGRTVRTRRPAHPRLALWGPLEARLQAPDRVILAGLNEGTWPRDAAPDPWMSYPMQIDFGLPPPARAVGLMAHDFVQSFAAGEVFLTRARRVAGTPTQPSRFLERLRVAMDGRGIGLDREAAGLWLGRARALDGWQGPSKACPPPSPRPPVAARPRALSQSAVGQLMRDPYGFYARRILDLPKLDEVTRGPEARDRGEILHKVLARVLPELGRRPTDDEAAARLRHEAEAELAHLGDDGSIRTFWLRRFHRAIGWLVEHEAARPADWRWMALEETLEHPLDAGGLRFVLTATADRIDRHPIHGLAVIDYKTGTVPDKGKVASGLEPQLPIEALLLTEARPGGPPLFSLEYWKLSGGRVPGERTPVESADARVAEAREGLGRLLAWLADERTVFLSRVRPRDEDREGDFDHLARVGEWSPGDWEGAP